MPMSRSIFPTALENDWWDSPRRNLDQYFGVGLDSEHLLSPSDCPAYFTRSLSKVRHREETQSTIKENPSKFQVFVDVSYFKDDDLSVTIKDNNVLIHAKHEEKPDQQGFITREFTRRYVLPEGVDSDTITATLSSDGILTVKVAKRRPGNERIVPVTLLESSSKSSEPISQQNEEQEENKE